MEECTLNSRVLATALYRVTTGRRRVKFQQPYLASRSCVMASNDMEF
jgi:hypothetical protein